MSKKLGKKEALGLILSEVAKLRSEVKALEKHLTASAGKTKPTVRKVKRKIGKSAAKPVTTAKKQPLSPRRPVLVESGTGSAPARSAG